MTRTFDAIVIGAGQAGPSLAGRLAAAGERVALIERSLVGGTCVNTGCTPTKTLVASARAAHMVRRAAEFGVRTGPPEIDMGHVHQRMRAVSGASRTGHETWLGGLQGLDLIRGHARFSGPDTVEVDREALTAPRIFVNVGARSACPDLPGLEDVPFLTSSTILDLERIPAHLIIVGGSYIGLEFAQIYCRFGAEVTVVERGPRLIPREDPAISAAIADILTAEGIILRTDADCIRLSSGLAGVRVHVSCAEGAPEVHGSDVLLAVGRTPNTDDLGLEAVGLETDGRGVLPVNDRLETVVPGIWALGECNGRGAFTHTSYDDYEIVAANLLEGTDRRVSDRVAGYALYIDPPLGRAGLTEAQARAAGRRIHTVERPMTRVGRAVEKGETRGLMSAVVDEETDAILGAAILGPGGDEAIHMILAAMNAGTGAAALSRTAPIHPTIAELLPTIMAELD